MPTSIFDCEGLTGGLIPRPYRMHTFHTLPSMAGKVGGKWPEKGDGLGLILGGFAKKNREKSRKNEEDFEEDSLILIWLESLFGQNWSDFFLYLISPFQTVAGSRKSGPGEWHP